MSKPAYMYSCEEQVKKNGKDQPDYSELQMHR